jgi:uncharacterized protein (TIGR02466 family)
MNHEEPIKAITNTLLLFGTPVFLYNEYSDSNYIHDTSEEQKELVLNRDQNYSSKNTNVLELEAYKDIKQRILNGLHTYVKDVLCIKDQHEFYITQSWLNVNPPNTSHHRHNHSNSIISGVYYVDTTDESTITFLSGATPSITNNTTLAIDVDHYNLANSTSWKVPVRNNDIIFFPSTTLHEVDANTSNRNRISLAFNCFVKGTFGKDENLNKLEL